MALVWITEIRNTSDNLYMKICPNDKSKKLKVTDAPEGDCRLGDETDVNASSSALEKGDKVKLGHWFSVGPGGVLKCKHFVIPWTRYGTNTVVVAGEKLRGRDELASGAGVVMEVGPSAAQKGDFLHFLKLDFTPIVDFPMGSRGGDKHVSGRLVMSQEGLYYQVLGSTTIKDILGDLIDKWGPVILEAAMASKGK